MPEGIVVAAGQDDPVHALSVCFVQHLLDNIALPVIDDVGGAVRLSGFHAHRPGTYGEQARCAAQCRTGYCYQSDGADAHHTDGIAELYIGQLYAVEAGGDHIAEHDGGSGIQAFRQKGEIGVCLIYMEILCEDAVFEIGKFPTGQHAAGVHGISALCFQAAPIRCDSRNDDPISDLQVLY